MKYAPLALALLTAGCGGVQSSPVAPSVVTPPSPVTPPPGPPPGPHFALELQGGPVLDGEMWVGTVSVLMNPAILRPETPASVRTVCGSETRTVSGFTGSQRVSCLLPVGNHTVTAAALMADGRVYQAGTTAIVTYPPTRVLPLHYDVIESGAGYTLVTFGFQTFDGAEYRWRFGDGDNETTRLAGVRHTYTGGSQERQASVQVTKNGRTLATGSVVGRW